MISLCFHDNLIKPITNPKFEIIAEANVLTTIFFLLSQFEFSFPAYLSKYSKCLSGSAASFGLDVKPRSNLCCTSNMDYNDPFITKGETL